jgi:hypothetical protein
MDPSDALNHPAEKKTDVTFDATFFFHNLGNSFHKNIPNCEESIRICAG